MLRSGVAFVWALSLLTLACEGGAPEIELETGESVRLDRRAQVHEVALGGNRPGADTLAVRPGDAVRFVAADAHPHAVVFDRAALSPEAAAFLERTQQLSSAPLVAEGTTWLLSLDGAPTGPYPFIDPAAGRRGVLLVSAD